MSGPEPPRLYVMMDQAVDIAAIRARHRWTGVACEYCHGPLPLRVMQPCDAMLLCDALEAVREDRNTLWESWKALSIEREALQVLTRTADGSMST